MCDCFHLAFPNWHGSPGTGAGRRLKGPEPGVDDDSICEEASEVLEEERPRPQGSSPVNEYPVTEKYTDIDKQAEEDIYDPYHKSSSIKKGKRIGFGSFFEKRSSAKISQMEDPEGSESRVFVRTVKKATSEGLVVSGGGKEGIFIKEVKPDSPASKHLTVKEGDQILSATVYFDNISYEDALQILEHARAYRMEMCLKRKRPASTVSTLESTTDVQPDREERAGQEERGRKAQRRHDVRISWPKFSSLGKGRKAVFKRSHSTSEAEDEKRLEMSPSTSDTESPLKTKEDAEAKTKKAKMKLKKTGLRSKSVDPDERLAVETHTGFLEFVEKHHPLEEASSQPSPEQQESLPSKVPHIFVPDDQEKKESIRIQKECIVPYMPDIEIEHNQHKAELISLDKTLKTTDITDSLVYQGRHSPKRSPDGKKRRKKQRSELKVNIQGKDKEDLSPDSLIKSPLAPGISTSPQNLTTSPAIARTPELSVSPHIKVDPKIISHTQLKEQQMAIDINTQSTSGYQPTIKEDQKSAREEVISPFTGTGVAEDIKELKADVGAQKKPPMMDSGKQWKERSILISDLERYGIRNRGPTADIGIARSHYVSSVNEVQASMIDKSDTSAVKPTDGGFHETTLDLNRPRTPTATSTLHSEKTQEIEVRCKDDDVSTAPDGGIKESLLHMQPPLLTKDINKEISGQMEKQAPAKFKLPKVDKLDFSMHEPILKTDKEKTVTQLEIKDVKAELRDPTTEQIHIIESSHINILPKREDLEIPGMEAAVPSRNIQMPGVRMTMDTEMQKIHDIKGQYSERDSASFKLPSADLSDIDLQQHITKTDVNAEKVKLTKTAGVSKPAEITEKPLDVKGTVPVQGSITDIRVPEFKIDSSYMIKEESKQSIPIFKLPRTEFPDADTHTPIAMTKIESSKITDSVEKSGSKVVGYVQKAKIDAREVSTEMTKIKERDNIIKLPKREDIEIPGMEASVSAATIQTSVKQSFRSGETDATIPKTKSEIVVISSTKSHSAIKLPKVKHPDLDVHLISKTDISTEKSGLQLESLPTVLKDDINVSLPNAAASKINLEAPKADIDVCGVLLETDIKGTFLEATANIPVSLPSVDVSLKKPDIDSEVPKVSADVKLPEAELTVSEQVPSVDVKGPRVEVEGRDVDGQGGNFKMPGFGKAAGPEINTSKPDVDITLPGAQLETQLPSAELQAPSVEGEVEIPEKDVKGLDVKIKKPKISFPNIDFQTAEVNAPETEITIAKGEISLQASIGVKGSKLDTKFTDVDVKEDAAIGDLPSKSKAPSMKLPKFGATRGKVEAVDVSADINVPEVEAPSGEVAIEIKAPDTKTEGMGLEVDKTKGKFKLPKVTMPDINVSLPKVSGPDINLKGPKLEMDVSLSKPETDIKGPSLETAADIPVVEPEGKTKFQMPHIKIPSFGISEPEMKGQELPGDQTLPSVDVALKKPDIDIDAPKVSAAVPSVDVKLPEAELMVSGQAPSVNVKGPSVEVESPDVDGEGSKFKVPKFGITFPKVKTTGPEISTSKPEVDITLPGVELEAQLPSAELEAPSVKGEVEIPEMDVKGLDVKIKKPKISFPNTDFQKPEAKTPVAEITIPKGEISLPQASVEMKGPKVDMKSPDVDVKADAGNGDSPGKFKLPRMKLPTFEATKGKGEGVDISADIHVPHVEAPSGEAAMKVKAPDTKTEGMGLEVDKTKGKFKLPKVTMPDINVSLPKVSGPEINLKGPKVETDVSLPKPETDIKGPSLETTADIPVLEPEGKIKFQMPHIKMPAIGISKPELKGHKLFGDQTLPSVDVLLKKPDIDVEAPKVSADVPSVDVKLLDAELTVSGQAPSVDVKGLSVEVEGPDVDGQGSKFKMPQFGTSFPKVKAAGLEISTSKPDVDKTLPEAQLKAQLPSAELEAPSVEGEVEIPEMDVKGPNVKIKKSKISFPKFGSSKTEVKTSESDIPKGEISLPQASVEIKGPKVDMKLPDVDVKADAGIGDSPSKFNLPSIKLPKFGATKGKVEGVDVSADINVPEVEVPSDKVAIEVKAPDTKTEGMGLEVDKRKGKFKLPKVTMPDINVSLPKVSGPDINLKGPKLETDVSVSKSETDIKGPSLETTADIPVLEPEGKIKFQMPHIKMPAIGISKPELKGHKLFGDKTLPSVDVLLKKPDIDVEAPKVSADVPSVDVKLLDAELTVSGQAPSVDVKGPSVEVEGPDVDRQGSKFKMPQFGTSFPKVKAAGLEISTSKPDVDKTLPEAQLKAQLPSAELEAPSVEGEIEIPEMDVKGLDVKIKKPKIAFPKFGSSKTEVKTSESDIPKGEISLPQASVEIKGPKVDMKSPDVDVKADAGIGDSPSKFNLPSIKLPKFGATKGKAEGVDISADINVPEVEAPSGEVAIEVKAPDTKTEGMGLEVDKTKGKFKLPKVTMPDINVSLPKVSGPEINLKGPKVETDVSLSKPETDIKGPSLETTADIPVVEPEGKTKFQMPHIKIPSFGFSKPEMKSRKLSGDQTLPSVDVALKKPDIDIDAPKVSADVPSVDVKLLDAELTVSGQAPSVEGEVEIPEMDVKGPNVKIKKSKISFPKFGSSKTEVKTSESDIPKGEISLPQASVEIKGPKVDMKSPDVDVKADAGIGDSPSKFNLPSIKLPKFGATKGKAEGVDISADINVPEVEAPSGEVAIEVKAPDTKTEGMGLEVDKTKGKFKLPKVTMPDINVSLPKVSGPEINLKGPKVETDVSLSKPETDIKGPSLETTADIPVVEPEGKTKFQMPHIKIPSFGFSKPEMKSRKLSGDQTLPSVDVALKKPDIDIDTPKVSADIPSVDVKLLDAELTVSGQAPSVDVKGLSVEVEGPDVDGQGSKFKMPQFGMSFPKVKAAGLEISTSKPDVDKTLPEAQLKAQLPSAELEAPSVEGEIEIPEMDVKGPNIKIKKPKISFPKFGSSKTEVKTSESDIPKGEISLPQASVEIKGPKVDMKSPDVDVKADAGIGDSPSKFRLPSIKLPKFGATKGKAEGVDISAYINVPEVEAPSGEVAIEVKAPDTNTEGMGLEVDKTKGKFKLPKVTMPDINVSLPKVSGPEINLKGPKVETDVSLSKPETDIKGPSLETTADIPVVEPEGKTKFQMPHIKIPSFGFSKPEMKSRKLSGDQTLPSVDVALKKPDIDIDAPKVSADVPSVDVKLLDAELTVSGQAPSVDVKGLSVEVEGPDVDGQGRTFKMPKFGMPFPKVKAAGLEISTSKPDVDKALPEAQLKAQLPSAELEAPSVEGEIEIPEMDVKGLDVKIKKPKISFPKFGSSKTEVKTSESDIPKGEISLPQASVEIKGPKVDMKSPDVDVKADAGIGDSPSKFRLPSIKLPKFGATKGKAEGVDISAYINVPEVEAPSGEVAIEVKAPDTNTEGMGLEVDKTKGKFKLPKVTMPDINVSLPKVSGPEINLKGPKVETDVSLSKPETDIKGPSLETTADIPVVEPEGKTKFQMPHIKIPSFGFSKPEMKSRKLSGDQTLPSVDVALKKPDIDIDAPKVSADVPSVDVKLLDAELTVSGQAPSVDVKGLSVEVEGPDVDGQGRTFKMPKFGMPFPKVKAAGLEISTSKPDVDKALPEAQLKAQLPSAELEAPSVEGEIEIPEMDVKGLDVKIKKPKISFPKFGSSKTEVKTSESDIPKGEISLPQASVEIKGPKVDMKSPDVDVKADAGIGDSPSKFRLPSIKLPKFGATKGKAEGVDISADINVPEVEAPSGEVAIEVKAPDTKTEGMGLEVDKTKGKFKLPKVTMPDINVSLPKVSGPEINLKGPKVETDVSLSKPETDIKGSSLETTADIPVVEPEGKTKFQMPHIKIPSFGFSKPEMKSRKLSGDQTLPSVDVALKKPDIDIDAPKVSADVPSVDVKLLDAELTMSGQAPSVDVKGLSVEVEGPDVDGQGRTFKMPKFGMPFPKVKAAGLEISTSKPDVDKTLPEAQLKAQLPSAELEAPSVEGEIEIPEMDVKGPNIKIKKPKISFPKFGSSKTEVKTSESDIPKGEISLPQASVEIKGPKVDMKSPDVDVKADAGIGDSPSKFRLPSIKLPKFGATKGKAEGVDISADINVPEVEAPSGEVAIEVKAPDTNTEGMGLEVDKTKGKFKLPKVTMPDINVSLPKVSGPEINLKGPKVETDVSLSKPETDIKGPSLETTADIPVVEPEGKTKFQMPHIKIPSFGFSKPEMKSRKLSGDQTLPSVDVALKKPDIDIDAPKVSADVPSVDVKLLDAELTMSGQAPSVDVKGLSVEVEGPDVDGQGRTFKMPKFGMPFPKVKAAGLEISTSKPDVDKTLPEAQLKAQLPSAELEAPSVEGEIEIPDMDVKGPNVKIKKSKISFPKFGSSKTEVKTSESDIPKGEISLPQASVEIKGPKVDMKSPDVDVKADAGIGDSPSKFRLPSIKLPKFGATKGKAEGVDISADINVPEVKAPSGEVAIEVKAPDTKTEGMGLEVDKTKGKFKLPKVTMPDINVSLPKVSGPEINLKGLKVETDVSLSKPETDIKGPSLETTADIPVVEPEGKTKFQMPHIKIPSFGFSKPEMKSRKLSGDQTLPSVDVALKKPDIDIDAPKISADVPSVDVKLLDAELTVSGQAPSVDVKGLSVEVEGPDVDGQGSKFKMPKFGTSFPKVKAAGLEISTSKPDVDKTLPEAQLKAQLPSAELEAPSVEGEVEIPEVDVKGPNIKIKKSKISFPMFGSSKTEVKTSESDIPKGEISLPQVNAEVEAPKVDMKSPDVDVKVDAGMGDSPSKFRLPSIKLPKFGAVKGKVASVDVSGDINVPEVEAPSDEVAIEVKAPDTELEDPTRTMSVPEAKTEVHSDIPDIESSRTDPHTSPSKFKFPSFKMPKFSFSPVKRKPSDAEANVEKMDTGDKIPEITCEGVDVDKRTIDVSKEKTSSFSLSFQKPRSRDMSPSESKGDTHSGKQPPLGSAKTEHHTAEISLEIPGADKGHPPEKIEEPEKSSKFSLPSFGDIFKGLELEFYVPTLEEADQSVASRDEISSATKEHVSQVRKTEKDLHRADAEIGATIPTAEMSTEAQTVTKEEGKDKSKFKFWFPRIGFSESLEESKAVTADTEVEKRDMLPETQQEEETDEHKTDVKEEKGSWFTFPKFGMSSPSKTPKETEITVSSPKDNLDKGTDGDAAEDISLTSSVKSSDAFADISSTITSEQVGLSETSPEKVTVKYSEPSVIVGVGQVKTPSEVITSTARTELIRLEPQLPDPVTVCVTSPSQDTLTDTGDIHIVTSNIQALPGTEHATIITKFETVGTVPLGKGSLKTAAAPWTVEAPAESAKESSGEKEIVEKHVIKEMTVDDKGTVVITEKVTHAAHAASEGPDGEDATSAVKKLKDSMHSEKMRFFDAAET